MNLVEDLPLSVIIQQEGSASSSSECATNLFNASGLVYSEISDWENITFGRYVRMCSHYTSCVLYLCYIDHALHVL